MSLNYSLFFIVSLFLVLAVPEGNSILAPTDPEVFDTSLHRVFVPYSDAAFANCPRTRRSAQGCLFKLFGGSLDWQS